MFRVALLSRWHVHSHKPDERYVKDLLSNPNCCVSCVWDRDEAIAKEWGEEYGVPYYTDLEAVLSRDDVDGVMVTSNSHDHKEILIAAANHKKHIFTEKVLAFDLEDAYAIKEAIDKNEVKFAIAFTRLSAKQLTYAKKLVDDGILGKPVMFRCMCSIDLGIKGLLPEYWFDPDVSGGGAMMDLGFNSAYLAKYIMGDIHSVSSSFIDTVLNKRVEDNASCCVIFENGVLGTLDTTFTSPAMSTFELAVYGTKGAYYARFGGSSAAELHIGGEKIKSLSLDEIPDALPTPVQAWVSAVLDDTPADAFGIDAAIHLVKYMNAAYASYKQDGKRVDL